SSFAYPPLSPPGIQVTSTRIRSWDSLKMSATFCRSLNQDQSLTVTWPSDGGRVGSAFTSPWFGGAHAPRATAVSVTPDPAIAERLVGRGVIDLSSSSLRDRDHWVAVRQSVRAKGSMSAGIGST